MTRRVHVLAATLPCDLAANRHRFVGYDECADAVRIFVPSGPDRMNAFISAVHTPRHSRAMNVPFASRDELDATYEIVQDPV